MKHLLKNWCKKRDILSKDDYEEVQERLINFTPPNNISRSPRPLDDLKHWKGTHTIQAIIHANIINFDTRLLEYDLTLTKAANRFQHVF